MTLKNEVQVVEKKSLATRVGSWYSKLGAAATVAVVGTSANAADGENAISFDFIDQIKSAFNSAFDGLQSIYGIAILIVLAIVVFGIMKGGTRKVG